MNEIRRVGRAADEIARVREIVARHGLPDFVTGFDAELGEFDDEPALWIVLHLSGDRPDAWEDRRSRAERIRELIHDLTLELFQTVDDRYPYFRLVRLEQGAHQAS